MSANVKCTAEQRSQTYKIHIAYRLPLINSTCSSSQQSEFWIIHANKPTAQSRFKKVIFRYYHVIQKKIGFIEIKLLHLCIFLQFSRQRLMLIKPPDD